MNKRQKLILQLAKYMHKATYKNSKDRPTFKEYYRTIKWCYKSVTNDEIRHVIDWVIKQLR